MRPGGASRWAGFERLYSWVVAAKGFDGAVELVLGVLLLTAPAALASVLTALAAELGESTSAVAVLGSAMAQHAATRLASSSGIAAFLLTHGVVKLVCVVLLLNRLVRWYPAAMGVLGLLLVVQAVSAVHDPSVGAVVLVTLDLVVLALVAVEYRHLRRGAVRDSAAVRDG